MKMEQACSYQSISFFVIILGPRERYNAVLNVDRGDTRRNSVYFLYMFSRRCWHNLIRSSAGFYDSFHFLIICFMLGCVEVTRRAFTHQIFVLFSLSNALGSAEFLR